MAPASDPRGIALVEAVHARAELLGAVCLATPVIALLWLAGRHLLAAIMGVL